MAVDIREIIVQAKSLPRRQRLVLLAELSESLLEEETPTRVDDVFWRPRALSDFVSEQGTQPLDDWRHFVAQDVWPEDDSVEDFERLREEDRRRDIERQLSQDDAS